MLNRLGSMTGDGMTPALIEGRTMELRGEANVGPDALKKVLTGLTQEEDEGASNFDFGEAQLLKELGEHLRRGSSGVCSLAVKCSFGSFAEAILAGTEEGEVRLSIS